MPVRDRDRSLAVGHVIDGSRDGGDDVQGAAASSPAPIDSTPRISASTPTSVAISPAFPRSTVTSTSSRIRRAVSVLYEVAPTPTGSSTTGISRSLAARPAASIASTQCGESVPMLSTSAPAYATISSTSSRAWAITGRAPSASVALAVSFMAT